MEFLCDERNENKAWMRALIMRVGCVTVQSYHQRDLSCVCECLSCAAGQRGRETRHHGRGHWECEEAAPGTGEDCKVERESVWILHARNCHGMLDHPIQEFDLSKMKLIGV